MLDETIYVKYSARVNLFPIGRDPFGQRRKRPWDLGTTMDVGGHRKFAQLKKTTLKIKTT